MNKINSISDIKVTKTKNVYNDVAREADYSHGDLFPRGNGILKGPYHSENVKPRY